MKITFCLPSILKVPAGGFKIVFEYANRLSNRGHDITIICLTDNHFLKLNNFGKNIFGKLRIKGYPNWFPLNNNIKVIATPYLDGRHFPDADFVVATAARTSTIISHFPDSKGKKLYLIQDYETWGMSEEELDKTYNLGLTNIVISKWLEKLVLEKSGVKPYLISNPIDTDVYYTQNPIGKRNSMEVGMLYHEGKHKGIPVAMKALELVKKDYPDLHVNLFGVYNLPEDLPNWFSYTKNANSDQLFNLYNKSAIFICASIEEGFGLTGAEAMACGCALVSTNYKGVYEYARDKENALLSPINDAEALARNIKKLIKNEDLRQKIAKQGSNDLSYFSWKNAIDKFEGLIVQEGNVG